MFRFLFLLLFLVFLFACSNEDSSNGVDDSSSSEESGNNSSSSVKDSESSSSNDDGESSSSSNKDSENSSSSTVVGGGDVNLGAFASLPTNIDKQRLREMYNSWISTYYITYEEDVANGSFNPQLTPAEVKGTARIKSKYGSCSTKGECTASEAIGYGMILSSLMEDWERFNKLLAYSKVFRISGTALMRWNIKDFRNGSGGSATDADIDIMASLFIAYDKTKKEDYLNDALEIGASIYEWEVAESTKLLLPAMNNETMGKGSLFNISYISLAAIKMLVEYDKSHDWNAVLEANISYIKKVQDEGDGLWPDWSDASGAPVDPANGSNSSLTASDGSKVNSYEAYSKETPRIPWRIAWYYHWFNDDVAKSMLDKGLAFLHSKGVEESEDIKNFYSYTGGKEASANASVIGWASLCALGMGSSENVEWMNSCNDRILNRTNFTTAVGDYYRNSLQLIYAMLFNGAF